MKTIEEYQAACDKIVDRIVQLIPKHPKILSIDDPKDLRLIQDFDVSDIQPTASMVGWALGRAKYVYQNL